MHYTGNYDYTVIQLSLSVSCGRQLLWSPVSVYTLASFPGLSPERDKAWEQGYVYTSTPVPDESSSSSGSSDDLSVGVIAGVAVGAVIGVILGVVFITVPIVLWRRRSKDYVLSAPEVQENQAYGTAISTGPALKENQAYGVSTGPGVEKNPAYGTFGMVL